MVCVVRKKLIQKNCHLSLRFFWKKLFVNCLLSPKKIRYVFPTKSITVWLRSSKIFARKRYPAEKSWIILSKRRLIWKWFQWKLAWGLKQKKNCLSFHHRDCNIFLLLFFRGGQYQVQIELLVLHVIIRSEIAHLLGNKRA